MYNRCYIELWCRERWELMFEQRGLFEIWVEPGQQSNGNDNKTTNFGSRVRLNNIRDNNCSQTIIERFIIHPWKRCGVPTVIISGITNNTQLYIYFAVGY